MTLVVATKFDGGIAVAFDRRHKPRNGRVTLADKVVVLDDVFIAYSGCIHTKKGVETRHEFEGVLQYGRWLADNPQLLNTQSHESIEPIHRVVLSLRRGGDEKKLLTLEYALQAKMHLTNQVSPKTQETAEHYLLGFIGDNGPRIFSVDGYKRNSIELGFGIYAMGSGTRHFEECTMIKGIGQLTYLEAVFTVRQHLEMAMQMNGRRALNGAGCMFMTRTGTHIWH